MEDPLELMAFQALAVAARTARDRLAEDQANRTIRALGNAVGKK